MTVGLYNYVLEYKDSSYINKDKDIAFASIQKCLHCQEEKGMGYNIKTSLHGIIIDFVCLDCARDYLRIHNYPVNSSKDICLFNFDLPRRYAILYGRWLKGKLNEKSFNMIHKEFSKFIYDDFIKVIEDLVQMDIEYSQCTDKNTEWIGYWKRSSGEELKTFFDVLYQSIVHKKNPKMFARTQRFTNSIKYASLIYENYCC